MLFIHRKKKIWLKPKVKVHSENGKTKARKVKMRDAKTKGPETSTFCLETKGQRHEHRESCFRSFFLISQPPDSFIQWCVY